MREIRVSDVPFGRGRLIIRVYSVVLVEQDENSGLLRADLLRLLLLHDLRHGDRRERSGNVVRGDSGHCCHFVRLRVKVLGCRTVAGTGLCVDG